ncbi:Holliday junction resolvase RecU [Bacillus sp. REN16]|uniref:Holliday junction resolvase RecU n=1 Tax=Bacillus sp. REN16 TaxID=2887296 RepID=UPI001E64D578|nr:Holliday junction resolvase RecU [Bacillus sp. REN16]MCC3358364.1 Holliday junction resolvase RecU [Bacillus sp. REN16]
MEIRYPNGKVYKPQQIKNNPHLKQRIYGNRGMTLEEDLNESNQFYLEQEIAVIHKKPTPVQIVNVDYPKRSAAVIKEAYFKTASTTDYNGIYKGRYIDFEAKETKNKTSFPLQNFHEHQIKHMSDCLKQDGICFVILAFTTLDEIYFLEAKHLLTFWKRKNEDGRKSITKQEIETFGYQLAIGYRPRIDYIKVIDKLYL